MRHGGIQPLKDLLARYTKTLRAPKGSVIEAFLRAADEVGVPLTKEVVTYTPSSRTLAVTTAGPKKNEILMRKNELLARLAAALGEKDAPRHII